MKKGKSRNKKKENKKQAPMDCDCCYRNSSGNFCSMRGRNVGNKGKCLEDKGRTAGGVHGSYSKTGYEEMYAMLHIEASGNISQEDFVTRNSAIYEGIEVRIWLSRLLHMTRSK